MKKLLFSLLFASLLFTSCSDNDHDDDDHDHDERMEKTTEKTTAEKKTDEVCQYTINQESKKLEWTAFKTTKKVPVKGVFDSFRLTTLKATMPTIQKLIGSTMFDIETASINSGNEGRDKKLVEFFFGNIKNGTKIKGRAKTLTKNTVTFLLVFNGENKEVDFKYEYNHDLLTITGTIDLNAFQANKAVTELNKACNGKHTGEDGVSKTWPEVDITFTTKINKNCK